MKKIFGFILAFSIFCIYSHGQSNIYGCISVKNNRMTFKLHKQSTNALCNNEVIEAFIWGGDGPSQKSYYVALKASNEKINWPQVIKTRKHNRVAVMTHPYFTSVSKSGNFSFSKIPDGRYILEFWHKELGIIQKRIVIQHEGF